MSQSAEIAQKILDIIPFVMRVMASEMRRAGFDIAPNQVSLLGILEDGPRTLTELAQLHSVSAATMSNTVTALEERGWVVRRRSEVDRRVVFVELSPEGQHIGDEIDAHTIQRITELLSDLDPREGELLIAGLSILGEKFIASLGERLLMPERSA